MPFRDKYKEKIKEIKMTKALDNGIFDRIHHSINMLHSLQSSRDTFVLNREEVDEKLFEEIGNFEAFIKHFENIFLQIVKEDLQAISRAAVINPANLEKIEELIETMDNLIGNFVRMESEYIARSQSLKNIANQFKSQLLVIKKDMEAKIKLQKKAKNDLDSAIAGLTQSN